MGLHTLLLAHVAHVAIKAFQEPITLCTFVLSFLKLAICNGRNRNGLSFN